MKRPLIMAAALDYCKTRKKLWLKFLIAFIPALTAGVIMNFIAFKQTVDANGNPVIVDIGAMFKDFVNVQISAVAILISFSIAIITILVSADNPNIKIRPYLKTPEGYNDQIVSLLDVFDKYDIRVWQLVNLGNSY